MPGKPCRQIPERLQVSDGFILIAGTGALQEDDSRKGPFSFGYGENPRKLSEGRNRQIQFDAVKEI